MAGERAALRGRLLESGLLAEIWKTASRSPAREERLDPSHRAVRPLTVAEAMRVHMLTRCGFPGQVFPPDPADIP
jgi:hypothetical protein